jgi:hypothetical protein
MAEFETYDEAIVVLHQLRSETGLNSDLRRQAASATDGPGEYVR